MKEELKKTIKITVVLTHFLPLTKTANYNFNSSTLSYPIGRKGSVWFLIGERVYDELSRPRMVARSKLSRNSLETVFRFHTFRFCCALIRHVWCPFLCFTNRTREKYREIVWFFLCSSCNPSLTSQLYQ